MALGSAEETSEIGVAGSTDFSSFRSFTPFAGEAFPTQTRIAHREEVSIRRLDAVLDEVVPAGAQRLFLKLDTQGWDIEALEGASGCLDRVVALQLEASARSLYAARVRHPPGLHADRRRADRPRPPQPSDRVRLRALPRLMNQPPVPEARRRTARSRDDRRDPPGDRVRVQRAHREGRRLEPRGGGGAAALDR